MTNLLKPPTDNLYKFIAIAGLVCFVVGVILTVQLIGKTLSLSSSAEKDLQELWLLLGDGFEDGEDETMFELLNEKWEQAHDGNHIFGLTQEMRKLGTLGQEEIAAVRRFEISAGAMASQQSLQDILMRELRWLLRFSVAVTTIGFILWYFKTQRYQDKLLLMQTEEQTPIEQQDGPANAGRKWTKEEETKLRKGFDAGKNYKQLAKDHGRTTGAIRSRLVKLGLIEEPEPANKGKA